MGLVGQPQNSQKTSKRIYPDIDAVFLGRRVNLCRLEEKFRDIETCFSFVIHCWPIRARECNQKNRKSVISPILQEIF